MIHSLMVLFNVNAMVAVAVLLLDLVMLFILSIYSLCITFLLWMVGLMCKTFLTEREKWQIALRKSAE